MNSPQPTQPHRSLWQRLAHLMGWTATSYYLFSAFFVLVGLIVVVWWPLVVDYFSQVDPNYPIWIQLDWLLIGIFAYMSLAIMARPNLRKDAWIIFIGLCGGLVIEGWGTQTQLWTYFTHERPPLWIIPAWPIASLSIDRIVRLLNHMVPALPGAVSKFLFYTTFLSFYVLMAVYVWPTVDKPLTLLALLSCVLLIFTPGDQRLAWLTFLAGSALGLFLEIWGTTRACWTYYTHETPPVFAVFAHGLAAFAFWRVGSLFQSLLRNPQRLLIKRHF